MAASSNIVRLVFQSVSEGSGFDEAIGKTNQLMGGMGALSKAANILGGAFGTAGAAAGRFVSMLMQGSVWGAAAQGVTMLAAKVREWRAEAALAAEAQSNAYKEAAAKAKEAAEAIKSAYAKVKEASEEEAKRKKADIELTKSQTKAELELAAAKARAAGLNGKARNLEAQAREIERKSDADEAAVDVETARKNLKAANKAAGGLPGWDNGRFSFDPYKWEEQRRLRNGRQMTLQRQVSEYKDAVALGDGRKLAELAAEGVRPENIKLKEKELEIEKESRGKFFETAAKAKQAAKDIKEAGKALDDAIKRQDVRKKAAETERIEDRAKAAAEARAEEEKRLRDQIAAAGGQRGGAQGEVGKWTARFNQAFDLWRNPEAAEGARVDAERRTADMKRFRRAVGGYGAKWRIDEAARLMREGDEDGLNERLERWRKGSRFNAQTEQMVLAAAAEQNRGAAERDIAEIAKNTRDLAKKLDDLLQVKG